MPEIPQLTHKVQSEPRWHIKDNRHRYSFDKTVIFDFRDKFGARLDYNRIKGIVLNKLHSQIFVP